MRKLAVSPSTLARQEFLRGPAKQDGDWIVLDRAKSTSYDPVDLLQRSADTEPLAKALASVRTSTDAIAFVRKFGLLEWGIRHDKGEFEAFSGPPSALDYLAEPYADFFSAADTFRHLIRVSRLAGQSADGIPGAAQKLRATFKMGTKEATRWVAQSISTGLYSVEAALEPTGIGHFELHLRPRTLLGFCWLDLAELLTRRHATRIEVCEACDEIFAKTDPRQRFCSERCGNRVRFRKFYRENRAVTARPSTRVSR